MIRSWSQTANNPKRRNSSNNLRPVLSDVSSLRKRSRKHPRRNPDSDLEVPVNDVLLVAVVKSFRDVQDVPSALLLPETPFAELLVELAARCELEDEVDTPIIVEVAEQAQDISMPFGGREFGYTHQRDRKPTTLACSLVSTNNHSWPIAGQRDLQESQAQRSTRLPLSHLF